MWGSVIRLGEIMNEQEVRKAQNIGTLVLICYVEMTNTVKNSAINHCVIFLIIMFHEQNVSVKVVLQVYYIGK